MDSHEHEYDHADGPEESPLSSPAESPLEQPEASTTQPPSLPTLSPQTMTPSSTPLGTINAARRPAPIPTPGQSSGLNQDIQAKMKAFSLSRQGARSGQNPQQSPITGGSSPVVTSPTGALAGGVSPNVLGGAPPLAGRLPGGLSNASPSPPGRPSPGNWTSMPAAIGRPGPVGPKLGGLAAKRGLNPNMKLSEAGGTRPTLKAPPSLPGGVPGIHSRTRFAQTQSGFSKYSEIIDTKTGMIKFKDKAVIHGGGIDFTGGRSFSISLDEVETLEELGKGNYGTVYKVRHCRPRLRRPGLGLKGSMSSLALLQSESIPQTGDGDQGELSNVVMAMKEIRLELDESKFTAIIMELDILHRCVSPFIIDFYGAFFQEGAVYICVEYMDGGSMEKLYGDGVPENILRKIALSTIMGLKSLKEEHNIIHRDVKPTNILVNTRGQVKICDFGVSGNLVASIAKTNIGCQSYMAPERIAGGVPSAGPDGGTYSVQSDIWSLGVSIVECARGRYPYPPESYNNIFSQLNAIVQGDPPALPDEGFSSHAKDLVQCCLNKNAALRPTYTTLLRHPWLADLLSPPVSSEGEVEGGAAFDKKGKDPDSPAQLDTADEEVAVWVKDALDRRKRGVMGRHAQPALHKVALDAVPGSPLLDDPSSLISAQK
ncbi:MAP kinase kinase Wis1 [Emydomyces testavorans]|uniref:mitogen-activated protein kinase kinase n=1 Tax=Emydomyces testavorans TaxID=2070801 RepID=A0AAF0IE47_9EURO|nr:MAP kinase kinase Wis1 [Emydomyces testavorans]